MNQAYETNMGERMISGSMLSIFTNLFEHPFFKLIGSLIASLGTALGGEWSALYTAALILLLCDQATGLIVAIKRDKFSATIFGKRTAIKLILYAMTFILAYQVGQIASDAESISETFGKIFVIEKILPHLVATWIALTEWESIAANVHNLGGKFPSITALKRVFNTLSKLKGQDNARQD